LAPIGALEATKVVNIQGRPHPTADGLIDKAHRNAGDRGLYLVGLSSSLLVAPSPGHEICVVQARGKFRSLDDDTILEFSGIGDASPGNCSGHVAQHYIRMAETRAISRMLCFALNVSEVVAEELADGALQGSFQAPNAPSVPIGAPQGAAPSSTGFVAPPAAPGVQPWRYTIPGGAKKNMHISDPGVLITDLEWWANKLGQVDASRLDPKTGQPYPVDEQRVQLFREEIMRRQQQNAGAPAAMPAAAPSAAPANGWKPTAPHIKDLMALAPGQNVAQMAQQQYSKPITQLSLDEFNLLRVGLGGDMIEG
jgi:hypothetical protein